MRPPAGQVPAVYKNRVIRRCDVSMHLINDGQDAVHVIRNWMICPLGTLKVS